MAVITVEVSMALLLMLCGSGTFELSWDWTPYVPSFLAAQLLVRVRRPEPRSTNVVLWATQTPCSSSRLLWRDFFIDLLSNLDQRFLHRSWRQSSSCHLANSSPEISSFGLVSDLSGVTAQDFTIPRCKENVFEVWVFWSPIYPTAERPTFVPRSVENWDKM